MERLAIWSGILILLLHLSCLESKSDLGEHSEVRQNVDGKDNRPFVRYFRGIRDFHGSGVGWRSNKGAAKTEPQQDSEEEHQEDEITTPPPQSGFGAVPGGGICGRKRCGGKRPTTQMRH
ncbi:hypothetical protein BV898_18748 [Hypsibius exemplaris]|uniref:Uncharacterized protein n=1 Tax=Hypsibius exemplaris TaxID=2072580 RepID=A0A9X6NI30_HYPEX|nr:hypothetical protein BV898_18748 [Hypsibius exemplaris]